MIAYVDASALLRVAFGSRTPCPSGVTFDQGISSASAPNRKSAYLGLPPAARAKLGDVEVAGRRATILGLIASLELVEIDGVVLDCAAQPMPTELGTLFFFYVATALLR